MQYTLWVGSYAKKEEPGIYKINIDTDKEEISVKNRYAGVENPTFLAEAAGYLHSVSESMDGKAALLQIDGNDLSLRSTADAGEMAPCHIWAEGAFAWTANYGGSVTQYEREGDAIVQTAFAKREGSGPNAERQDASHVHSVTPFPDGNYLLVCDLGTDTLAVYEKKGLTLVKEVQTAPGSGPRMALFHPELSILYVINELDSTVSVYKTGNNGEITHLDTLAALPAGYSGPHTGADLKFSPDKRFLYAAIRGWNGFAVFDIEGEGTLSMPRHVEGAGKTPRSFFVLPEEPYIVTAYQDSDEVALFKIEENGLPVFTGSKAVIAKPVCVIKKGDK